MPVPSVLFMIDDGADNVWPVFELLRAKNVRATLYVPTDLVGTPGYLTVEQLQEMDAAGWDIGNHTKTHVNLTTLTQEQAAEEVALAQAALDGWGLTRASRHVAYPGGQYNATVIAAMQDAGMLTGRETTGFPQILPPLNNYELGVLNVVSAVSAGNVEGEIAAAVARGEVRFILNHEFTTGTPSWVGEWTIDNYIRVIDYCIANHIYPLTISDFYALQSGPVTVPRPW